MWRIAVAGVLLLTSHTSAQEIDTAIAGQTRSTRFTILDQIENPEEREAFTRLYKRSDPRQRRDQALAFINRYPDSWLLSEAYEIAAKASIDSDDLTAALDYAVKSLRLWPENALLLVPIASVQAKMQMYDAAVESANRALECLDRFDRPASIKVEEWPRLQRSLRAASYFVLGRVAATRGLGASGQDRARSLAEAERWLGEALKLDGRDAETLYLMGLVRSAMNELDAAAACFAETWRLHKVLQREAMEQLKAVYSRSHAGGGVPFEQWTDSLKLQLPVADTPAAVASVIPEYAGSQSCRACHEREYASWKSTGMSRMFRSYRPEYVLGDFSGVTALVDEGGAPSVRALLDHGRPSFEVRTSDGKWARYPVEYVIGSKWQQAYATRFPGGEIQVFPVQFNLLSGKWINYWKTIDPPGTPRTDPHRFSAAVASGTYQFNCAPCHTSQLRFASGELRASRASFAEGGINCEMCHGPSARHATAMRNSGQNDGTAVGTPVDFGRLSAEQSVAICAQCHMQSAVRAPEKDGTVNFSENGPQFYRTAVSRPYVDFSRKAFYKDGRFRMTTFIAESFVRSACFRKGQATCNSCHDPHPANAPSNPVSLKFPADSDEMCVQCHKDSRLRSTPHTRHPLASKASRCVSCHMPRIMEALLFNARSHQIDDVPDAGMTARFGRAESPNACLLCHKAKDAGWLAGQLAAVHVSPPN